jgi:hypothetical protein
MLNDSKCGNELKIMNRVMLLVYLDVKSFCKIFTKIFF